MDIKTKAEIIEEFIRDHALHISGPMDDKLQLFFAYNTLGIPFAQGVSYGLLTLTSDGEKIVNETYSMLCDYMEVPDDEEFDDFDDLLLWIEDNEV